MSRYTKNKKSEDDYMSCYFHPKIKENYDNPNKSKIPRICSSFLNETNAGTGKLKGIFKKDYLWNRTKGFLTVKFINTDKYSPMLKTLMNPDGIPVTYTPDYEYDNNKYKINWDPLEDFFYKKNKIGEIIGIKDTEIGKEDPTQFFDIRECIKKIINERLNPLMKGLPIIFVEGEGQDADIRIQFNQHDGCYSDIGKHAIFVPKNEATMNLAWFDVGTVLHEFGHVIGLLHEHQSPYRYLGLKFNFNDAFYEYFYKKDGWDKEQTDSEIEKTYVEKEIGGTYYDPDSVMLYFIPDDLTIDGKGTTTNKRFSKLDMVVINYHYGKIYRSLDSDETLTTLYEIISGERYNDWAELLDELSYIDTRV